MIVLPPAVPLGAAGEKNCVFASNSLFSRPFFDVSAQNFCAIHGNLAAYCVIPPNWGGGGLRPVAEVWSSQEKVRIFPDRARLGSEA